MLLRKYWIPISVFLLVIVGVGLYYLQTRPEKDPIVIYKAVEPLPKSTEQPTTQAPVGDTSQDGHVHADGTWHEGGHEKEIPAAKPTTNADLFADGRPIHDSASMRKLEREKRNKVYKEKFGLGPPPDGYGYLLIDGNEVVLNPDGTPVLQQLDLPDGTRMEYEIEMREGFAPTREQWEHYQQLKQDREVALHHEDRTEAARIQAEITHIEKTARGLRPFGGSGSWMIPTHLDTPAYQARLFKMETELKNKALIHLGMEYLIRPEGPEKYYVGPR